MTDARFDNVAAPLWQEIVDTLPMPGGVADAQARLCWCNRRWREQVGAAAGTGDRWFEVADGPARDVLASAWAERRQDAPLTLATTVRTGDGPRRGTVTLRPLASTGGAYWIATLGDGDAAHRAESDRDATQAELDTLTNAMPQMVWATRPDGYHDFYNAQWYRFTGMVEGTTDGEGWNGMFHPDDQDRAWARWRHSLATGDAYEIEYRLRHADGRYRWVLGRALPVRDAGGTILRWIGTCTDIDAAKRAAERNEILSRELSHRIKNIFAVISGLIRMSARRMPEMRTFADDLAGRIASLGRAHDLARPHSERSQPSIGEATLHGVLRDLLSPYATAQWRVGGDDVPIDDRGATPIALVFHELATNAAKYGALSVPAGTVEIVTRRAADTLTILWQERGGPPVVGEPDVTGFGTRLAALSIEQQMDGTIERDWHPDGLCVRIAVPADGLVRTAIG